MSLNHRCQIQNSIQANVVKFIGDRLSAFDKAVGVNSIIQHHCKSFRRKSALNDSFVFSYLDNLMSVL